MRLVTVDPSRSCYGVAAGDRTEGRSVPEARRGRLMARAYLELFAGGAACALALMGGPRVVPPVGYMGGKRKLAPSILGTVGLRPGQGADRVLLCDAGEWGGV